MGHRVSEREQDALDRVAKLVALLKAGDEFKMIEGDEEAIEQVLEMASDARALLRDAAQALRESLAMYEEFEGPMYGPFPGGDPREFEPDREDNTPEEIAAWEQACAEWDAGTGVDRGPSCATFGDASAWTGTGFGMGTTNHKSPEGARIRDLLARIEGGASS